MQRRRKVKKIILLVVLLAVFAACLYVYKTQDHTVHIEEPVAEEVEEEEKIPLGSSTYCIFGLDTREPGNYGRSDMIMLLNVNHDERECKIVSVYRDTVMEVNKDLNKCNAAYSLGGANLAVRTLEKNLDIDIDRYLAADFKTVIELIDTVGGVEIDVTEEEAGYANQYIRDMNALYDLNSPEISEGEQTLDGVQATAFARIRYTEGWDFKRTERQRNVFEEVVKKIQEADEDTYNDVREILFTKVYTDMGQADFIDPISNITEYEIISDAGFPKYKKGMDSIYLGSCVVPDDLTKNVKWLHKYFGEKDYKVPKKVKKINEKLKWLM